MLDSHNPDSLPSQEHLAEIGEILAAGLMRLRARKSSPKSPDPGESSLDFSPHQSGHAGVFDVLAEETSRRGRVG
jgi:hypothetical protein